MEIMENEAESDESIKLHKSSPLDAIDEVSDTTKISETNEDEGIPICTSCMEEFKSKLDLREHYIRFHKELLSRHPEYINVKRVVRKIARHMCVQCSKHFGDPWTLKHHQKTVHQVSREHECPKCGKNFLSNKDMLRHYHGVHMGHKIAFPGSRRRNLQSDNDDLKCLDIEQVVVNMRQQIKYSDQSKGRDHRTTDNDLCFVDNGLIGRTERKFMIQRESKSLPNILKRSERIPTIAKDKYAIEPLINGNDDRDIVVKVVENVAHTSAPIPEEPPIFQLENLENLQFVLPEGSGEPQIIIPESGIRLTIPSASSRYMEDKQILHLVPENMDNTHSTQIVDNDNAQPTPFIYNAHVTQIVEVAPFLPRLAHVSIDSSIGQERATETLLNVQELNVHELTKNKNSTVVKFQCEECCKFFISQTCLDKHVYNIHLESLTFEDLDTLVKKEHTGKKAVDVEVSFDSFVKIHVNSNNINMECKICGIQFKDKDVLSKHRRVAHRNNHTHKCESCKSEFTSRQTLKAHMSSVHEGIKKVCSYCLKPVADLVRHVRSQHRDNEKKPYTCDDCSIKFKTNFSLQRHKETVHLKVKAWNCDLCEKSFGEKRDMIRHKSAIHFGIKNKKVRWVCPECNTIFKLRRDYDRHKASKHPNLTEDQVIRFLNSELETKKQKLQISNFKM